MLCLYRFADFCVPLSTVSHTFSILILWKIFKLYSKIAQYLNLFKDLLLKLVSAVFIKFLFFHQIIALQKLWKMLFISSKNLFRSQDIHFFVFLPFPLFLPVGHCFGGWSKINLKVHDIINCLNKNSITHFVHRWSIR